MPGCASSAAWCSTTADASTRRSRPSRHSPRTFPELPEPHNNLAVLYAARGDLDRARAALDEAVRALPSYALAHENLGDIHLRLAERAYERATRADSANRAARAKLVLARELIAKVSPAGTGSAAAR